jgi:2-oxoglutarate ferredoxin oxidoreductase subunit alpha
MLENEITIMIAGEAGMGVESSGVGFCRALTRGGRYVFGYPSFYSRIRGGHNYFTIRTALEPVHALGEEGINLLLALDLESIRQHVDEVVEGGAIVYDSKDELPEDLKREGVTFIPMALTEEAGAAGAVIMRNTMALGAAAELIGFDVAYDEEIIRQNFAEKGEKIVQANLKVHAGGVRAASSFAEDFPYKVGKSPEDAPECLLINGSQAFGMGALAGGCRFVSGYPMTPGSPVLQWLTLHSERFNVVSKHAEDEIAAICMAIGAGVMGARALVPTSGGGFALMVEAMGLAGITETPVVIYNAQRPGPATGLATRTEQADLLFMMHAPQGEFPRMICAPGTHEEAFKVGWQVFNWAERYQTPILVLGDQYLADSFKSIEKEALDFDAVEINRGELLTAEDLEAYGEDEPYLRYKITESGISPRALPGHPNAIWVTTGNEHWEDGAITEEPEMRVAQMEKRFRKQEGMRGEIPAPTTYGPEGAEITLVCWGSLFGPVREAVDRLNAEQEGRANLIHFCGLEPFPPGAEGLLRKANRLIAVEQNFTGQLETLIHARTGIPMDGRIRKYDGRPVRPPYIVEQLSEEV